METKNKFITIDKCILKALGYSRISTAIKFLRKYPIEFKSGKSCDDTEADYVLERISKKIHKRGCPQKHDLLMRENSLEKWMKHKRLQLKKKHPIIIFCISFMKMMISHYSKLASQQT